MWRDTGQAMSQEPSDVVRALYDAVNRRDSAAFLSFTDPDVEFTSLVAEAEGAVYRGHGGALEWWDSFVEAFEGLRFEVIEEPRQKGGTVVVHVRVRAPVQGVEVAQDFWQAFRVRSGKGLWWATFRTAPEALEAVGLPD
jgi:ketosteroid isomerase-like protein